MYLLLQFPIFPTFLLYIEIIIFYIYRVIKKRSHVFFFHVELYQQLQILHIYKNSCFQSVVFPTLFLFLCICNTVGTTITVSLGSNLLDNYGNVLFPFLIIQSTFSIMILGGVAGFINWESKQCLSIMKRRCGAKDQIMPRLVVAGLAPLKIKCASVTTNVVTPLIVISACVKTTTRFLLAKK